MCSRSYERIVAKVPTDIRLDNFSIDAVTRDKIFVLALRAPLKASGHFAHGKMGSIMTTEDPNSKKLSRSGRTARFREQDNSG